MNFRCSTLKVLSLLCLLAAGASAQLSHDPFNDPSLPGQNISYGSSGSVLMVTVHNEKQLNLDRQAVVKLTNKNTAEVLWQTSDEKSNADFGSLKTGAYEVEVSAVGYLPAHQEVLVQSAMHTYRAEIVLKRDPASIELAAPTAAKMPSKARKETVRGVAALKSGDLKEAEKHLQAAYKLVPSSSDINFLLGYLFFQKKEPQPAEDHLKAAISADARNVQALTLLGRLRLQGNDYPGAQTVLEQAVAADPDYWMAHNLLADTYLRQRQYEKSKEQALLAIETGKGGGTAGQIVLGEALANMGQKQEAIQALNSFLQYTPESPTAPQVHALIAQLEKPDLGQPTEVATATKPAPFLPNSDPLLEASKPGLSVTNWEPAGIDDVNPAVASGVSCPYATVLDRTSEGVKQLVDDVSRFEAIEDLLHEDLDELGHPVTKETRKFDYVVSISEPKPGFLTVDEYRSGRSGMADFPDQIATRGLPALALVFHPDMRDNFQITCEGLGQWNGQATWLLHFRQRDDRPNRIREYKIGSRFYPVDLKGRAWITANTFHIVRIESELVSPMPKIQLLSEHYRVDYGPVRFDKKNVELWLPKNAELYFNFRKHRYFRRHSFGNFMLFSVDSQDTALGPKAKKE